MTMTMGVERATAAAAAVVVAAAAAAAAANQISLWRSHVRILFFNISKYRVGRLGWRGVNGLGGAQSFMSGHHHVEQGYGHAPGASEARWDIKWATVFLLFIFLSLSVMSK